MEISNENLLKDAVRQREEARVRIAEANLAIYDAELAIKRYLVKYGDVDCLRIDWARLYRSIGESPQYGGKRSAKKATLAK